MSATPKNGDTIRSKHGLAKVVYFLPPDWKADPTDVRFAVARPWLALSQGKSRGSFETLRDAVECLQSDGYTFEAY